MPALIYVEHGLEIDLDGRIQVHRDRKWYCIEELELDLKGLVMRYLAFLYKRVSIERRQADCRAFACEFAVIERERAWPDVPLDEQLHKDATSIVRQLAEGETQLNDRKICVFDRL